MNLKKAFAEIVIVSLIFSTTIFTGCVKRVPEDPNTLSRTFLFDGLERTYRIHIPADLSENPSPALVFVLHGGLGTGEITELGLTQGGFNKISDEEKILVVYPDGIDKHWNDGRFSNDTDQADDVGFLSALIDSVIQEFDADPQQVFFTGISNGAMMSYRLAFDIPEKIAAIAPVAGSIPTVILPDEVSGHPLSVCIISGTRDPLVPWEGGMVGTKKNPRGTVISVPESAQYWVERNNCDKTPESKNLPNANLLDMCRVNRDIYMNGDNGTEVVLYKITRGGHTWPGGTQYFPKIIIGRLCKDIDANTVIWDFFSSHPKV